MDGFLAADNDPERLEERWRTEGECLLIRPIRRQDAPQLDALFHRLTPDEVRLRFFAFISELTPEQLAGFTDLDYERDMALAALRVGTGEIVGIARLNRERDPERAEFAVVVEGKLQSRGLAAHLMRSLLGWAKRHGVHEVRGSILAENAPMLELAQSLGFALMHSADEPQVIEARIRLDSSGDNTPDPARSGR